MKSLVARLATPSPSATPAPGFPELPFTPRPMPTSTRQKEVLGQLVTRDVEKYRKLPEEKK